MTNNNSQKGFAVPVIIAIVALVVVVAGVGYYAIRKLPQTAQPPASEKTLDDGTVVKPDGTMIKPDGTMIKPDGTMVKPDGTMAKKESDAMMGKIASVTMTAQNASGQTGTATLTPMDGKTKVVVAIPAGAIGVPQPAHIHMGVCPNPGAVVHPLTSVAGGKSETILDISFDALYEKLPLAINVHKSKEEAKVYTSCGDLSKGAMSATMDNGETMMSPSTGSGQEKMMAKYTGTVLAGKSAPLLDFTKADYDAVVKSDKLVVLYFYANWCPICKEEVASALYPAFNELTTDKVIGIRINYKDSDTTSDEVELARQFGVSYQHTKVFLKNGKQILKAPDSWNKTRYLDEVSKAIAR